MRVTAACWPADNSYRPSIESTGAPFSWNTCGLFISQPRLHKAGLEHDFPDLLQKPVDAPYGPYADGFSTEQHKYGPFAPIRAALTRLNAERPGGPLPRR
jgi:cytochrome c